MKKRIASLLMAVVMTATLGIGAMAATTEKTLVQGNNTGLSAANFKDLADNSKPDGRHWAWDSIDHVVKYGLFNGTSATTFAPQNPMTRAQFVVVVTRLENASRAANNKLNVERVPTETRFTDVPTDMWCAGAVAWAEANGIVEGYSDNTFRPNQAISRAQIAAFVYRYVNNYKKYNLKTVTPEPAQFTDFALASEVFHTAINYCRTHGLINGYSDHTLRPNISVTRAQVAAILSRIILVLESRRGGGGSSGGNPTTYQLSVVVATEDVNNTGAVGGTLNYGARTYSVTPPNPVIANLEANTTVTFSVAPDTTNPTNPFRAIGPAVYTTVDKNQVNAPETATAGTFKFKMPAADTTIEVSFTNAALTAAMNNSLLGFYNGVNGTAKTPSGPGTYYLRIDKSFYEEGKDLLSFDLGDRNNPTRWSASFNPYPGFNFKEEQALGLYGKEDDNGVYKDDYNDGWYSFYWDGSDLAFNIETTDSADYYTYGISVKADLASYLKPTGNRAGKTLSVASPEFKVEGRPATEDLIASVKYLNDDNAGNDSNDNGMLLRSFMKSVIETVENTPFTLDKPALLNRVMKQSINDQVEAQKNTMANSMKQSLVNSGEWVKTVEDGIWAAFQNTAEYQSTYSQIVDTSNGNPIKISNADLMKVKADTSMVDDLTSLLLNQVNTRLENKDLSIGAKLVAIPDSQVSSKVSGVSASKNTSGNSCVERYFQIQGTATIKPKLEGEDDDHLVITIPDDLKITVTLEPVTAGTYPTYTLAVNPALNGGNSTLSLGSIEKLVKDYSKTIDVGKQNPITVDLTKMAAGVPVYDVIDKETIDDKVSNQTGKLDANTWQAFYNEIFYDSTNTQTDNAFVKVDNDLKTTVNKGLVAVEVLRAIKDGGGAEDAEKASVIHVTCNPDYWAQDGESTLNGSYFDAAIDKAELLRQAMKKDGNTGTNYYNRMGRGEFGGTNVKWRDNFDQAVRVYDVTADETDARYAFAEAVAKSDSKLADMWRTLGLSQSKVGNNGVMTFTYTKDLSDGHPDYAGMLDDLIGAHQAKVTVTVTRTHK